VAGLAAATACSRSGSSPLSKAAQFLWSQQGDDGGWHSRTYGLLRSGQSLTPFVLEALLGVPEATFARPKGAVARAFDFLKRNTNADGALGLSDSAGPDYPCYATAVAARMSQRTGHDVTQWISWLRGQQFTEDAGWKRDDPAFGGWGMGLRFYYAAAVIRAVPGLPLLLLPQHADGSWSNPNNLVKEDDPLIATGFAVRVLTAS